MRRFSPTRSTWNAARSVFPRRPSREGGHHRYPRAAAALADTPKGQDGRPSKSLTLDQAVAVITAARTLPVMELRPGLKDVRRPAELICDDNCSLRCSWPKASRGK
jgi:hypothetical protein